MKDFLLTLLTIILLIIFLQATFAPRGFYFTLDGVEHTLKLGPKQ